MFALETNTPALYHEICDCIRLFCNEKKIPDVRSDVGYFLLHTLTDQEKSWYSTAILFLNGVRVLEHEKRADMPVRSQDADARLFELEYKRMRKRLVKLCVYECLQLYFDVLPPWGSLTGIRPTKLLYDLQLQQGRVQARQYFLEDLQVTEEKYRLADRILSNQQAFRENVQSADLDVYVGIPFCTSRCSYCSFVSREIQRNEPLKSAYLDAMIHEIEACAPLYRERNIRALYLGGGTPTALDATDFERLLDVLNTYMPHKVEYTVEAGRPDTIDRTKLDLMKRYGVNRVSVNAQTTNEATLERIGRAHSMQAFYDAFALVRAVGFDCVNTDIILGLPGEDARMAEKTIDDLLMLRPENITAHTLAIKNAAFLAQRGKDELPAEEVTAYMVQMTQEKLLQAGYEPYYLYRQKYMAGNLENVGFCMPGEQSIYNIDIMEETVSNLAFGAGAISKRVYDCYGKIERQPNLKDITQYIERIEEMIHRKILLFES